MDNLPDGYLNNITLGDCRDLSKNIPDHSIDVIFTDPPYKFEYINLYEWLAKEAERLLKPTGFLLVFSGIYHKNKVINILDQHLEYYWDFFAINNEGPGPIIWSRKIISKGKSILAYHRQKFHPIINHAALSIYNGSEYDKRWHVWQQDLTIIRYYLYNFLPAPNTGLVLDPFVGGGTVPYACKILGCDYIAFEIDPKTREKAMTRIANIQPVLFDFNPAPAMGSLFEDWDS